MTDIVGRLRRLPPSPIAFGDSEADKRNRAEREEAADEIERLRRAVEKFQALDMGQPQGQSLGPEPAPSAAAATNSKANPPHSRVMMHPLAHSALIGVAVMATIAASFALGRGPAHQLRDKPFDQTLHEDLATMAAMSERIEGLNTPRVVQVEPIKPEPDPLMMVLSEPQPMRRKAAISGDICAKHNMRKVYYGSTWRCRK